MNPSQNESDGRPTDLTPENIFRQYVAASVLSSILLAFGLYILTVTILYEYKVWKVNCSSMKSPLKRQRHVSSTSTTRDVTADRMRYLIFCSATIIFVRQCLKFVELQYSFESDRACNTLRGTGNFLYASCLTCVYIVIWCRQRIFYRSKLLRPMFGNVVKTLSASVIVIMVINDAVGITLFLATRAYMSHPTGCVVQYSYVPKKLPGIFLICCTVLFQGILLGLFLYPLVQHKKRANALGSNSQRTEALIKRTFCLTLLTVIVDLISAGSSVLVSDYIISIFRQLMYDTSLMVACCCVIGCFPDWKQRMFPFLPQHVAVVGTIRRKPDESSVNATGSEVFTVSRGN